MTELPFVALFLALYALVLVAAWKTPEERKKDRP